MKLNTLTLSSVMLLGTCLLFPEILGEDKAVSGGKKLTYKNAALFGQLDKKKHEHGEILKRIRNTTDTLQIHVIYRELPVFACGYLSTASLTVGIDKENDTLVAVSLCDLDSSIVKECEVYLLPSDSIPFSVSIIGHGSDTTLSYIQTYNSYYCDLQRLK